MSIRIFYDNTAFRLRRATKIKNLVSQVITGEGNITGDINIVFTSDDNIRKINIEFLEHDYFTDVISFDYNKGNMVNGEIYISVDTVRANAENYNVSLSNEMLRVIIHGILHLSGYDDKTEKERSGMREKEDFWMNRLED